MNEASGRLGRARFLRLGWFRPYEEPTPTEAVEAKHPYRGLIVNRVNYRQSPRRNSLARR